MTCTNKVSFWVERGFNYREVKVKCGNTNPWGDRTICDKCAGNSKTMKDIERHEENVAADNEWLKSAGWGEM
jgi:hypothetical protein